MNGTTIKRLFASDRWRIIGWLLALLGLALLVVVVTVRSVLLGQVAERANSDVSKEVQEFTAFAAKGVDPSTGQPFQSTAALFETYLGRQQISPHELMVGWADGRAYESRGREAPSPAHYDLAQDQALLQQMGAASSGVHPSPAGEMRWGRAVVTTAGGQSDTFVVAVFTDSAEAAAIDTVRTLALVSLAALVMAGLISWVVAGQILRPVRLVHQAAAEITENDLSRRIPVTGKDDISDLASTFNAMLDRLDEAFATQRRFVDDAGHELRTPITVVRGHLELMGDDPEERKQTIALVTQELDRMARIVRDLLALAKADRPDFIVLDQPVDVAELTMDLDAKMSQLAPRKWLLSHVAEGQAILDAERITQAVLQLADNAVQHTGVDDPITLASRFVDDPNAGWQLRISVADTGPGIAPENHQRIFERFAHGRPADGSQHAGAGLGLPIVQAIAEGHGGYVELDSALGEGATFTIVIPAPLDHAPETDDGLNEEVDIDE